MFFYGLSELFLNLSSWLDYIETTSTQFNFKSKLYKKLDWEILRLIY
jgi:hypothetical protein